MINEIYPVNSVNTPLTEELLSTLDSRSRTDVLDFFTNIPFVQNLTNPNRKRAKDLEKVNGKIVVDIINPHILEDMDYFRQAAIHFQKHGVYTFIYPNKNPSSEYRKFWDEERRRCLHGMVRESDGEWISGYYYFYLNYTRIHKVKTIEGNRAERVIDFPDVWDGDYLFFHYIEQAESNAEHASILKCRGRGYSFKAGSMAARNYSHIKASKSYLFASETEYLTRDGVMSKAVDNINFVDSNTPFGAARHYKDTDVHKRASYRDLKTGTEQGRMSEIMAVTCKNDPDKGRGKRGKLLMFDESGIFPGLLKTWTVARKSVQQGKKAYGLLLSAGTGGVIGSDFEAAEELFYHGDGYGVMTFPNVWDKNAGKARCSMFVPEYLNRDGCYDANGNSDVVKALIETIKQREVIRNNSSDPNALVMEKAECVWGEDIISVKSLGTNKIKNFKSAYFTGIEDIYEVKTLKGRVLHCTSTHPIYNGTEYKALSDYNIGDRVKILPFVEGNSYQELTIKGNFNFDSYKLRIDEDWARFIGLFMGDGSFYFNTVEICFDEKDVESIEWTYNFIKDKFGNPIIRYPKGRKMVNIRFHSIHIKDLFIQMDLICPWNGNKHGYKRNVHTPDYIFYSPKSVISEYLKGYFDADSGIYEGQKNIKIHCKYDEQLISIQKLLSVFGINAYIKKSDKIAGDGHLYTGKAITLKSFEVDLFKEYIGYISKRKQDTLDRWCKYKSLKTSREEEYDYDFITSIEFFKKDSVYNITTDEHYYSVGGIWTHNSPITCQEAVLRTEGSIFPIADLKEYLADIMPSINNFVSSHYIGDIVYNAQGELIFKYNDTKVPVREYPIKDNINKEGCIEIFELPQRDAEGKIAYLRYIAGIDPVDDDSSTTNSLPSILILDRFTDRIVAEYTGRPRTAVEFYDICIRLLEFYSATANNESDKKGIFGHFSNKNKLNLLCDTPQILKDKQLIKDTNLYGNKAKGTNSNKEINKWGRRLQADWLVQPAYGEEETGKLNMHKIRSIGYLKELIAWNPDMNADRVSAMGMLMIYREDLAKFEIRQFSKKVQTKARDKFFSRNEKFPNFGYSMT